MNDAQIKILYKLEEAVDSDEPKLVKSAIHKTLKEFLLQEFSGQINLSQDPIFMYTLWNNWFPDRSFNKPGYITQDYAAVQFLARCTALVEARIQLRRCQDSQVTMIESVILFYFLFFCYCTTYNFCRCMMNLHKFLLQGSPTPMGILYGFWGILYAAAQDEVSIPSIWFDETTNNHHFIFRGMEFSVDEFRALLHHNIDKSNRILKDDILMGLNISLPADIFDDPTNMTTGYSFLTDQRNHFKDGAQTLIEQCLKSDDSSIREFFGRVVDGLWVWNRANLDIFLQRCQHFLKLLLISMHLSHGQPMRGTEILASTFVNLPNLQRSIMSLGKDLVNAVAVNKIESLTGSRSTSPHFLCTTLKEQLLLYLAFVCPMEILIAKLPFILPDACSINYSYYLFTGPKGRWKTPDFANILHTITREHFGDERSLGVADLRQVLIAMYRQHCNATFAEYEAKSPDGSYLSSVGDYQANHGSRVATMHYGVELREVGSISQPKMRALRTVSSYSPSSDRFLTMFFLVYSRRAFVLGVGIYTGIES